MADLAPAAHRATPHPCRDGGALAAFLDRHFDGTPGLAREFPLLLGGDNAQRRLVLEAAGQIVAHAAWRPLRLRSRERAIATAGIGLVATHRAWRGRGLASLAVEQCVREARAHGLELALLFGAESRLYRRLGFVPAGRERLTRPARVPVGLPGVIRRGSPRDARLLLPLLERHELRVERTAEEFERLLAIPGVELFVLECGGVPLAYCVAGKGRDLRGVIHEWAGDAAGVDALIRNVAARDPTIELALSPEAAPPPVEGTHALGVLAQMRVLSPERLGSDDPRLLFGDPSAGAESAARIPIYVWGLDSV